MIHFALTLPAFEMFAREFDRVILNVNEIHRQRSAALLANILYIKQKINLKKKTIEMKVMPLIGSLVDVIFFSRQ